MTWLTWRQLRLQAAAVYALVAAIGVVVLVTGPRLRDLVTSGAEVYDSLTSTDQVLFYAGLIAVAAAPAVIGAFWGAPLVARELENGTHRLVWNQSVTPDPLARDTAGPDHAGGRRGGRAAHLGRHLVVGADGRDRQPHPRRPPRPADPRVLRDARARPRRVRGLRRRARRHGRDRPAPLAPGDGGHPRDLRVRPGRRPAVGASAPGHPRHGEPRLQRGHARLHQRDSRRCAGEHRAAHGRPRGLGALQRDRRRLRPAHRPAHLARRVPPGPGGPSGNTRTNQEAPPIGACLERLTAEGYRQRVVYQPEDRFWPLQLAETGLFLVASGLLAGLCFWWTRSRLS